MGNASSLWLRPGTKLISQENQMPPVDTQTIYISCRNNSTARRGTELRSKLWFSKWSQRTRYLSIKWRPKPDKNNEPIQDAIACEMGKCENDFQAIAWMKTYAIENYIIGFLLFDILEYLLCVVNVTEVRHSIRFNPLCYFVAVMIATEAEMVSAKLPIEERDYCAHHKINYLACRADVWPLAYRCAHEKHALMTCQFDEWVFWISIHKSRGKY